MVVNCEETTKFSKCFDQIWIVEREILKPRRGEVCLELLYMMLRRGFDHLNVAGIELLKLTLKYLVVNT